MTSRGEIIGHGGQDEIELRDTGIRRTRTTCMRECTLGKVTLNHCSIKH